MAKSGPKPKLTCSKGHNFSLVGKTKSGNCKQCKSDYYRVRREFIKQHFLKQVDKDNSPK
jgi:hypothetical protein